MSGKIISLFGYKGGIGRTALTLRFGTWFKNHGFKTLLIDASEDEAFSWISEDINTVPRRICLKDISTDVNKALFHLRNDDKILGEDFDFIIIDTNCDDKCFSIASVSDFVICPTNGSPCETQYLEELQLFLRVIKSQVRVLLTGIYEKEYGLKMGYFDSNEEADKYQRSIQEVRETISKKYYLPLYPIELRQGNIRSPYERKSLNNQNDNDPDWYRENEDLFEKELESICQHTYRYFCDFPKLASI